MLRLAHIVAAFKEYFILALLIVISLFLLTNNDNRQIRAIRSYTVGFIGAMQSVLSVVPNLIELKRENEILHRLNVDLSDEASRLREARSENIRLREMLKLKERKDYTLVPAGVIGKSLHLLRNTITLDVGEEDGVKPDMPIISELGLVGKIVATSSHYSIGQLLLNKDFRASAKVERSRVDCIISWEGGDNLRLKNISKKQDVKEEDVVVTSEYSNAFPRDIKVGFIAGINEKAGSLFKDVDLRPAVDFSALEEVFVITALADTERTSLEKRTLRSK